MGPQKPLFANMAFHITAPADGLRDSRDIPPNVWMDVPFVPKQCNHLAEEARLLLSGSTGLF
eukprot:scaffold111308_cov31-Prasinocladus_malaysianus.AAC.2